MKTLNFIVTTVPVAQATTVTITATVGGASSIAQVAVVPPVLSSCVAVAYTDHARAESKAALRP
jgi:hypothetical protein